MQYAVYCMCILIKQVLFNAYSFFHQVNDSRCDGSIIDLIQHHVSTGTVCVPGKEQSVNDTMYICTTDSNAHPLNHDMLTDLVYIHWDLYRYGPTVMDTTHYTMYM